MNLVSSRRGIALIWVSLVILVFIAFAGLAIDTGFAAWVGQQLQVGADASALAAAVEGGAAQDSAARDKAISIALANEAVRDPIQLERNDSNDPAGDIVFGRYDRELRTFDPAATAGQNAVKVVARRTDASLGGPLPLLFAPIFGVDTINIQRYAIAMTGGGTGAGIIALAPTGECALSIDGNVTVVTDGEFTSGAIQVNSDDPCGSCVTGSVDIQSEELNTVGEFCLTGGSAVLPPEINDGAPFIDDPLAFLQPPLDCVDMTNDLGTIDMQGGEVATIDAGWYSGGISINNGTLTMNPGIYVLDGVGFHVTGSANLLALGIMLYITGTGSVDVAGTGSIVLTAPDPELYGYDCVEEYEGVTIFQDRANTNPARIIGTGLLDISGSIYFPSNHLDVSGDSAKLGNQLIAWTIHIFGNGTVNIEYDGRNPAPGRRAFLVE